MKFFLAALPILSLTASGAFAGFQPAMGPMECSTLISSEVQFDLKIEKVDVPFNTATRGALTKTVQGRIVATSNLVLISAPTKGANIVLVAAATLVSPALTATISQSVDGKRTTRGQLQIAQQAPLNAFCAEHSL